MTDDSKISFKQLTLGKPEIPAFLIAITNGDAAAVPPPCAAVKSSPSELDGTSNPMINVPPM